MSNPPEQPVPGPPELSPLTDDDPRAIGPFRVVGRLGAGGMGAVYGALDDTERCVAVKVIHPRLARRPEYREQFAREVSLVSRIDAECAPAFLGADPEAEHPWMATEFVAGRTLSRHVAESGPLGPEALLAFAAGCAEGLDAVHAAGVVHRDVKPGNIVLAPDGPKVLDFGIARPADDTTDEQGVYGTPGWIAPERLDGARGSTRSDVFAWGGLVVYAATGHGPFGSGDTHTLLERARAGRMDLEGLPDELVPLVRRALSRDPAQRPDASTALRAVLDLAAPSPGDEAPAGHRGRLRALLQATWRGFDAAGHRPEAWVAVGAAGLLEAGLLAQSAAGSGAATGTGGGAGSMASAGGAAKASAGLAGMGKATTAIVAAASLTAVVSGGWVAGRAATDNPIIPTSDSPAPSASSPGSSSPEAGEPVKYQGMTLRVPKGWGHERFQQKYNDVQGGQVIEEAGLVLTPDSAKGCGTGDWTDMHGSESCRHVKVLGAIAIEHGGPGGQEVSGDSPLYQPGGDPGVCPDRDGLYGQDDPRYSEGARVSETTELGGRSARYSEVSAACLPDGSGGGPSDMRHYDQRNWLVDEEEILIVDNWDIEGLPDIVTTAEFS